MLYGIFTNLCKTKYLFYDSTMHALGQTDMEAFQRNQQIININVHLIAVKDCHMKSIQGNQSMNA